MRDNFYARRDANGMAVIGRPSYALKGIRFAEGEQGDDPADPPADPPADAEPVGEIDTTPPDVSAYAAKIAELTAALAEAESVNATLTAELNAAKAHNYDLLISLPGSEPDITDTTSEVADVPDIEDFFVPDSEKVVD